MRTKTTCSDASSSAPNRMVRLVDSRWPDPELNHRRVMARSSGCPLLLRLSRSAGPGPSSSQPFWARLDMVAGDLTVAGSLGGERRKVERVSGQVEAGSGRQR